MHAHRRKLDPFFLPYVYIIGQMNDDDFGSRCGILWRVAAKMTQWAVHRVTTHVGSARRQTRRVNPV